MLLFHYRDHSQIGIPCFGNQNLKHVDRLIESLCIDLILQRTGTYSNGILSIVVHRLSIRVLVLAYQLSE